MSDFNFYTGDVRTQRLINLVKQGLQPPIEDDESIRQFLSNLSKGMTTPQYVAAYRARHAASPPPYNPAYNPEIAEAMQLNFRLPPRPRASDPPPDDDDPPLYNPAMQFGPPPHPSNPLPYNPRDVARFRQPPGYDPSRASGRVSGGIVAASAPPPDDDDLELRRAMQASMRDFNIQNERRESEERDLKNALALSMLAEQPRASLVAAAPMLAAIINQRETAATACGANPLWLALTEEQREPFYVEGTTQVNVNPDVKNVPNPNPTKENPNPTKTVPNRAMRGFLELFFSAGRLQSNFDDTCSVMADVDLFKNGGYDVQDLFRDSIIFLN